MFKSLFGRDKLNKPFLVNDHGQHKFADLGKMPESQLVMLVPRQLWRRLSEYIPAYEAVGQAGRFGAEPGDYEWEWIANPEAVRWWRRSSTGAESLFGMAVSVERGDQVELYGLVEVDQNSPHWAEVIPEEAANGMPGQAKLISRKNDRPEQQVLIELYRDYFRAKGMLTFDKPGEIPLRRGTIREVERFRDALRGVIARASKVRLPMDDK